ncbi:hypothetical protein Pst134EA_022500 [Puccinia striiformis f. sp. tritici]|uniref:hypothetical protein n=1 Tax=Puccinia striiformis f. sp. tritici TaxID=168172 RepID=UPI002008BB15|nr:hypothetical protein Pst134EA_022500 [Puccinia striiformis f. sp. tritici]KAH9455019.1 hypothetical protein Pst134EA_022500 [Puccinia striiformis f. sp. tritici]
MTPEAPIHLQQKPPKGSKKTKKQNKALSRSQSGSQSPTPFPSPQPPPQSEHPSAHEFNSDSEDGFGTNHSKAKQRDESELLPAIDPMIDSMDAQFCQDNPSRHFDGDSDESVEHSNHPKCIVPLAELQAMTNLDDEHCQQALDILASWNDNKSNRTPVASLLTPYPILIHATTTEHIRQCSKDAFLETNLEMYTRGSYKPGTSDFSLLTIAMEKLMSLPHDFRKRNFPPGLETTSSVCKSFVTLVRNLRTHLRCSIREKLLCGVVDHEGNITPGLVLPRLHKIAETIFRFLKPGEMAWSKKEVQKRMPALFTSRITHIRLQTLNHLLHPPLQRKVSQWTLIDEKLKDLKAHGSDYRAAFYKAILIKDQELFGMRTPLADIDSDLIVLPSKEEVLTQLAIVLGSQSQPGPSL